MNDGVLSLEPLKFGVAGGTFASTIHLDGSRQPLKGRFTVSARHLKLKQLFPDVKTMQSALGEVNGDASLAATGNSPAALAATSSGELKAVVTDGTLSRFLMEAAGLNVANVVIEKMYGNRDVKINCGAADLIATNGTLTPKVFALDTDDAFIDVGGTVDLRSERLDLKVRPHTKGVRLFSLRSPLYVKGTFKSPDAGVEVMPMVLRGGAAVALGLINPFAALIPFMQPSSGQSMSCDELLNRKPKAAVQPVKASASGAMAAPAPAPLQGAERMQP
jgi:uncharacterized protein involved in outer membrane biogenesis